MGQPTEIKAKATWWQQLQQRKVVRVTSLYVVLAWGLVIGSAELLPTFGFTDSHMRILVIVAVAMVPVVALLAWLYEITPHGIRRDPLDTGVDLTMTETVITSTFILVKWQGDSHRFTENITIGRDVNCTIQVDDPQVSRQHVSISLEAGLWILRDMGSSNGTRVNGKLVKEAILQQESEVRLHASAPPLFIIVGGQGLNRSMAPTSLQRVQRPKA